MNFIDLIKKLVNEGEVDNSSLESFTIVDSSDASTINDLRNSQSRLSEQIAKYVPGVGFFDSPSTKKTEKLKTKNSRTTTKNNVKSKSCETREDLDRD